MPLLAANIHFSVYYADDWQSDGYRWKQNGFSFISNKNKEYKKIHFNINTGNGLSSHFQKFVYRKWQGSDNHFIVHYIGNEDCAVDFPHGKYMLLCLGIK